MKKWCTLFLISAFSIPSFAQTLNDGPIQLQVKVRDINTTFNATDEGVFGVGFAPDELTYKLWIRDNADLDGQGWVGGTCLQADFSPPTQSPDFNHLIYNYTFPTATVPQFFDIKLDAWEDDLPSDGLGGFCQNGNRCDYNTTQCCGVFVFGTCIGLNESDDYRCNADPFKLNMNYRLGPPCQWYNHGYVIGSGCSDNYYQPRMESYWRYTKGTSCNDAIALGNVFGGFSPISHYNSNECYSNNFPNSPGNDVFYEFNVTSPVGLKISMCANASFNTTLYLLDQNCNTVMEFNDDFCAVTSEINVPICTPGIYKLVVDAASAAEMGTFTLTLSENSTVIVNAEAGSNINTCSGIGTNIGGSPAGFGGQAPYTYSWTPTQYLNDPTLANPVANPPSSMYFYLTVTDDANCTRTDSVFVTVLPGPNVNLGNDTTICVNSNHILNAGPGNFYFWSNGATVSTIPVNQAGQYFVTVLDNFGCQGRDTIIISTFPDLIPNIPANSFICNTPQASLDAGPGYTSYTWNNQPGGQTFPVTGAGVYTLSAVDANNCTYNITTNVTLNPLPTPNLGADQTLCPNQTVNLNPGAGYTSYLWNTTAIDQIITVTQPGVYSVTVTDGNNCQASDQITISNYPLSNVNLGPDVAICNNGTVTITAQNGFASYFWSTGSTQNPIQVTSSALYWVFATDNFGCVYSDTVSVSVSPQINLSQTTLSNVSCFGENDGFANISVSGGTAPLQFSWNNGAQTQNLQNVSGGVYTLTVTDANNCSENLQVIIEEPAQIAALLDVTHNTCEQTSAGVIEAKIVGGLPPYSILWNTGETSTIITGLTPGEYFAIITDASGCQATDTAKVITLNINVGTDQIVIPNVFTPNGDNINDLMSVIFNITGYESFDFVVLNRWGNKVFETKDPSVSWDGGKHPDGTYFYVLKAVLNCGTNSDTIERTGTITVAR